MEDQLLSNISFSDDSLFASSADFLPGAQILLVDGDPASNPTQPIQRVMTLLPLIQWGIANNYPQEILGQANHSPELLSLIGKVVAFTYGQGLTYEVYEAAPTGNTRPNYVPGFDQEVEDFIAYNRIHNYLYELITDLVWFNHGFSENIKNKKGNKIVQVDHQEAAFCRFSRQNNNGYSDLVYINANWPAATYADDLTIDVPCINPKDFNKIKTVFNAPYKKFIYPTTFHSPGSVVYKSAQWHSLFKSQWFEVSKLIPILKHALMKYQMTIKYVIKVPQEFWVQMAKDKGKDWTKLNYNEKKALRKIIGQEMNEFLTGAENAGKSFLTTFGWDQTKGIEIPGIQIDALDDKLKDGAWLEDSQEASSHFIRSMDLTPSLVGHMTGKGMGAGSGSDSRIHFNILNASLAPKRDRVLENLNFIAQYNGWTQRMPGFRWKIREIVLDTLDVNHNTANPKPSPDGKPDQQ